VRTTVSLPAGTHTEVEEALQSKFGLDEAVVVDSMEARSRSRAIWGRQRLLFGEHAEAAGRGGSVVERGAVGDGERDASESTVQEHTRDSDFGRRGKSECGSHATQVTRRLADLIGGEATLLPAPGVVGSKSCAHVLMKDRFVREALDLFPKSRWLLFESARRSLRARWLRAGTFFRRRK